MQYTAICPNAIPNTARYWTSGSWWNFGVTVWKLDSKQLKDTKRDSLNYSDSPPDRSRYQYEIDADLYRAMIMIY